ncbi:unnamed protein product, partial [Iphiclides podalirius]
MKKCRLLNVEYECMGVKEVYSDMMMDCFGLLLSHMDGKPTERLVCATCVTRLREAFNFRQQVLRCEEAFLQLRMDDAACEERHSAVDSGSLLEIELVKEEHEGDTLHNITESTVVDALADDNADDTVKNEDYSSNDDLPLKPAKRAKTRTKAAPKAHECADRPSDAEKVDPGPGNANGEAPPLDQGLSERLPMSKVQQLMRERDPSYMTETNILTIVEYSFACPFKCRHNHLLCYYCGESFAEPGMLRRHTGDHHQPRRFKVTEHKSMVKLDLTRIDCRLCPASIRTLDEFKSHVAGHGKLYYPGLQDPVLPFHLGDGGELCCALCDSRFPYFHALNKHMNVHYSNYVCETCGLGFVDRGRFVMHQQRHERGDYPCEACGKSFRAQYNRDLHVDRVHRKRARVYCPKCDARLMTYQQKLRHLVEVHGEQPLRFPCGLCERVCDTRRSLTIHRRKDHLKDYRCAGVGGIGWFWYRRLSLTIHRRKDHLKDYRRRSLTIYRRKDHLKDYRYECHCCGHKFFTRFALNNHMPTHTKERNFKCKVCEKSYPRLKTLKDHMRIHTNDRRYRCHVCGQAFIQNCSLKGHMKSQHPEYG